MYWTPKICSTKQLNLHDCEQSTGWLHIQIWVFFLQTQDCPMASTLFCQPTNQPIHLFLNTFSGIVCMAQSSFSLNQPLGRFSLLVVMSVCLCVCPSVPSPNTHFRLNWRLLVEGHIANISLRSNNFFFIFFFSSLFLMIYLVFQLFWVLKPAYCGTRYCDPAYCG